MNNALQLYESIWGLIFAALLLVGLAARFWLASRQIRHVATHRHAVPTPFDQTISLPAHQKAADYTVAKLRVGLVDAALAAAILVGWTLMGGLHLLNQWLMGWMGQGMHQQLALLVAFATVGGLLELPVAWYRIFRLEQRFGFNRMTPRLWLMDGLKGVGVGLVIGLPVAALVMWLMDSAGAYWWLWAWAAWMGFNLLLLVLYPTVIAPLFNQFKPLDDEALKTRIQQLMQRCGFSAKGLFVMDGSKRSAHANAYFTGFGPAKRVVFFDTLLQQLSPAEIDAVLAHELGHFRHRHIIKRIGLMCVISLVGFALLGWLSAQVWFYAGLGVTPNFTGSNSALALILFLSVVPLATFFITPLMSLLSRQHEFEADAFAMAHADGKDLASALLKLYQDNASTLTPDPLYVKFYYSHPPASERLARMPV
jgi:STE24 endopeptidase